MKLHSQKLIFVQTIRLDRHDNVTHLYLTNHWALPEFRNVITFPHSEDNINRPCETKDFRHGMAVVLYFFTVFNNLLPCCQLSSHLLSSLRANSEVYDADIKYYVNAFTYQSFFLAHYVNPLNIISYCNFIKNHAGYEPFQALGYFIFHFVS